MVNIKVMIKERESNFKLFGLVPFERMRREGKSSPDTKNFALTMQTEMGLAKMFQRIWNDWTENSSLININFSNDFALTRILSNILSRESPVLYYFHVRKMNSMNETRDNENSKDLLNFSELIKPIHLRNNNDTQS